MTHPESVPPPKNPPPTSDDPPRMQQVEYFGRVWGLRGSSVATQLALIAAAERNGLKITFGDVHRRRVWRWVYAEGIDFTTTGLEPEGLEYFASATHQFRMLASAAFGSEFENRLSETQEIARDVERAAQTVMDVTREIKGRS